MYRYQVSDNGYLTQFVGLNNKVRVIYLKGLLFVGI